MAARQPSVPNLIFVTCCGALLGERAYMVAGSPADLIVPRRLARVGRAGRSRRCPYGSSASRCCPSEVLWSAMRAIAERMARVTLRRARSVVEPRRPFAATEADRAGKFGGEELDLILRSRHSFGVVPCLGFAKVLSEIVQPLPVLGLGLRIEPSAQVAVTPCSRAPAARPLAARSFASRQSPGRRRGIRAPARTGGERGGGGPSSRERGWFRRQM